LIYAFLEKSKPNEKMHTDFVYIVNTKKRMRPIMYSFLHIFRLSFVFGSIIVALVVPSRSDANNIKCSRDHFER